MYFYKIPAGEREALACWNFVGGTSAQRESLYERE
jgi:hypothetical protein